MPGIKQPICVCIVLLSIIYHASASAVTTIHSIRFEGNEETQELFLRRQMVLSEGDVFDEAHLAESLQALVDTDLFKSVDYYLASDLAEDENAADAQIDLVVVVKEKHYLLLLPRIRVKDNQTNVGLQLHWDNIFGMNHRLRLLAENRGSTVGVAENRSEFEYEYPNIRGSRYSLGVSYVKQNEIDDTTPGMEVNRKDQSFGFGISRWLNDTQHNYGWFANMGWGFIDRQNDALDILQPDESLRAVVLSLGYGFAKTHEYDYTRSGKEFGYKVDISNRMFGSESEFARHELYYRSYYRFESRPEDNLNVQIILGHASHDIMGGQAFNLGGDNLRGYAASRFLGNAVLQINMEYLTPFDDHPRLRYVGFVDLGNTYENVRDVVHLQLKAGAGVGLRWKIPSFVKLSLRVDLGYAFSDKDYRITAGTRYSY